MSIHERNIGGEKFEAAINPLLFEGEHLVRQMSIDGDLWFVGADVCKVLGLANPSSSLALLDDDERTMFNMNTLHSMEGNVGNPNVVIVSEAGVYRLVFKSRKPVAERFKRWLAHEVIPSIRKTGSYGVKLDNMPDAERREFPEWPMEELRTKRGIVDMYRLLYGVMAAQWISPQMGFPIPPVELVENGRQMTMVLVPQMEAGRA